jgi:hypothetical protein
MIDPILAIALLFLVWTMATLAAGVFIGRMTAAGGVTLPEPVTIDSDGRPV